MLLCVGSAFCNDFTGTACPLPGTDVMLLLLHLMNAVTKLTPSERENPAFTLIMATYATVIE
jgi:hypothetical protein